MVVWAQNICEFVSLSVLVILSLSRKESGVALVTEIKASGQGLSQAYESLAKAGQNLEEILADLDDKVATLRGEWSGEATEAYTLAQREWTEQLERMRDLVTDYGKRLERIDGRYRAASKKITDNIWR